MSSETVHTLGGYQLTKKLGAGSFGEVWLAENQQKEQFALKFLKINPSQKLYVDLFKHEFQILCELRHAHLARVFDFGLSPDGQQYYFTQELCPGKNFLEAVQDKPLDYFEKALVQILSALDYVHGMGIVHFDIKADNILVQEREEGPFVKILDFGVAAKLKALPDMVGGTPAYMAPELCAKSSQLDHRVDLYALGILVLRALTKKLPFNARDVEEMTEWHLHGALPSSIWDGVEVPRYLREIVEKLLSKNPDDRFSNARVILNFINRTTGQKYKDVEETLEERIPVEGPLVGRALVLNKLNRQLDKAFRPNAKEREASLCFIEGEQGIGKSRIVDEVRKRVEVQGIGLVHLIGDRVVPLWPQMIQALKLPSLGIDDADDQWRARRRVDLILEQARKKPLCLLVDEFQRADDEFHLFAQELYRTLKKDQNIPLFVLLASERVLSTGIPSSCVLDERSRG
ncbi:MAG: serine/threonine-protein kinase, partial [bacterium]|nr:serine/threonine-protein kinase [bacterium]